MDSHEKNRNPFWIFNQFCQPKLAQKFEPWFDGRDALITMKLVHAYISW